VPSSTRTRPKPTKAKRGRRAPAATPPPELPQEPIARTADGIDVYCAHTRLAKVAELKPNPRNPNTHPKAQLDRLGAIIAAQGWRNPIVISKRSGLIVKGHARYQVSLLRNWSEVPIDEQHYASAAAEHADLIADNRIAELAQTDDSALANLLAELQNTANFDPTLSGYNDAELTRVLRALQGGGREEPDTDLTPPVNPKSVLGTAYALGPHVLFCGDSTVPNAWAFAGSAVGAKAEVLWTDPPYGVSYVGKTKKALTIKNDGVAGLSDLLRAALGAADPFMAPGARFYISSASGPNETAFRNAIVEMRWQLHQGLAWVKDTMVLGHSDYHYRHETILYGWKLGEGRIGRGNHNGTRWYGDHSQTSVFEIARPKRSEEHPTMKPGELVERCLLNSSKRNDIVIDPFGGSGTTLIACEQLERRCAIIELDPAYCDVIRRRYAALVNDPSLAP
jgi:site-specific DNA-methyltransferase (adenine-specific)